MPEETTAQRSQRVAREIQTKFEFWLVGLIFAVLALAVQTAPFTGPKAAQICELLAWVSFLLAGILGIFRLEWTPPFYWISSVRARHEFRLNKLEEIRLSGQKIYVAESREPLNVEDLQAHSEQQIQSAADRLDSIQKRQLLQYKLLRGFLVGGFLLLFVARGYEPALRIVNPPTAEAAASAESIDTDN